MQIIDVYDPSSSDGADRSATLAGSMGVGTYTAVLGQTDDSVQGVGASIWSDGTDRQYLIVASASTLKGILHGWVMPRSHVKRQAGHGVYLA